MSRILVIGDIHGGLRGLIQVLDRAQIRPTDKLIFLGDYVDGWSESAQVINLLIELETRYNCIFIKGNHDVWCHTWLEENQLPEIWWKQGGKETVESYQNITPEEKEKHILFFRNLNNYYIDEENRLFIHAGFSSMHGPSKEIYETNYTWDRTLWELAVAMDSTISIHTENYPKRLKLFSEIFIGHTPTLSYRETTPMHRINVWNIDTGAGFLGSLTCLDISSKEFWQSDTLPSLYPDELGRNK